MSFLATISLRKKKGQTRESIIALFEADLQLEFPETNHAEVVVEELQVVAERDARKPRTIPEDEHRCHARTRVIKKHFNGGKISGRLKVMRDEPANLYGGRCESKKLSEGDFCKSHLEKQPCGIWNGMYGHYLLDEIKKLSQ